MQFSEQKVIQEKHFDEIDNIPTLANIAQIQLDIEEEPKVERQPGYKSLECKSCEKVFSSKGALYNHKKSKHEGAKYSCKFVIIKQDWPCE